MDRLHPHDLRALVEAILTAPLMPMLPHNPPEMAEGIVANAALPSPGLEPPRPAGTNDPAMEALDAIANLCGIPCWGDDPLEVVRVVGIEVEARRSMQRWVAEMSNRANRAEASCADAEAQVDRLKAALDLEAKARSAMAEGLADAKEEWDKLVADARTMAEALAVCERWLQCRCSRPEGMDYRDECPRCSKESPRVDLLRGMAAAAPYLPDDSPAIRAEDLVEALDDDPEPHRGWDEGHDTPEERNGER